ESRRRLELALGLDRLSWVDASNGELPGALLELGHQIARGEIHLVVRTPGSVDDAALREAIHRGAATLVDIERVDLPEAVVAAVERALVAEAGPAA
ncbi:MAG TPA: hypothetical protein VKE69_11310, partial [Planctomycetota bacterium]|nr:hypothetical protein [Planctomycetota bacterium]